MPSLRLALGQLDPCLGDLDGNAALILAAARTAAAGGADLLAVPEMALTGYPVEDLALRRSFQDASRTALVALATDLECDGLGELPVLVGYLEGPGREGAEGPVQNALALLHRGAVRARYAKHHLPNYGVFDEARYFSPGHSALVLTVPAAGGPVDVAVAICEDLWREGGPVAATREAGAGLLVVVNGSPYERGKTGVRTELLTRRAGQAGCPLAYVNLVGGQDELVFDGASVVVAGDGTVLGRAAAFAPEVLLVDLELDPSTGSMPPAGSLLGIGPGERTPIVLDRCVLAAASERQRPALHPPSDLTNGRSPANDDELGSVWAALVTGTRDYVVKNGFRSVLLGLSGGIDSALSAAIAIDALGADAVHTLALPSEYSSEHSLADAAEMARRTGIAHTVVPIAPMVEAFTTALADAGMPLSGLAAENLQARVRGMTLMSLSNQAGHLVLATGNKSELAVGYSTIYGDAVGGYAPLKDVYKTDVWRLSRWRNEQATARGETPPIPENSIEKPPSAELRPDQLDSDSLPDYDVLDALLVRYIEGDAAGPDLVADGFDPALVERILRLVDLAEYKRRQYPPGPKVTARNFGRDRRLPITSAWRDRLGPTATMGG